MTFDWDEFNKLTDEEKAAYMKAVREAALKEAEGKTFPPGSIAPEKARFQEGSQVIGHMNADGTVHYYSDDEKPTVREKPDQDDDSADEDGRRD
ncbi:hypothetical protein CLV30_105249 [Haloactinopolyspora alba]|uniref:Uncharacterized protein n=1 Tax=Haloactinopolyspora alba TaxID=648780 RepID=A0A2P8E5P8_9ACTN|nr:hypothetical protein [Haloactinopolyspora alba]PSL04782.1 hypothetical protein CLV30_105249 [Haloactinopolyspora alba]